MRLLHDLPKLLETSTPALEILHICGRRHNVQLPQPDLGSLPHFHEIDLPHLRDVHISPAELFPQYTARSLRKVSLDTGIGTDIVTWQPQDLLQALRNCPNVEVLHFERPIPNDWLMPEDAAIIPFPSLHELWLLEISNSSVYRILNVLAVPPTALICVVTQEVWSFAEFLPCHIFQRHPLDRVVLRINDHASHRVNCFANRSQQVWDLFFDFYRPLGHLGFGDYFQTMHITRLEVLDYWDFTHPEIGRRSIDDEWVVILQAFAHLTHLTVCGADGPSLVLLALARPTIASDPTSARLLCPALKEVAFGWRIACLTDDVDEPMNLPEGCAVATYRSWDNEERIRWRCSEMRPVFEQRVSKGASQLQCLVFWEFETTELSRWERYAMGDSGVRIPPSRHDDKTSSCLAELRGLVGGSVVYGGCLSNVDDTQ